MSIYNRYYFTKKVYPNYLILIIKKGKYYSYGKDKMVLNYIGFNNKLSLLKTKKINYLILDDLDIIKKVKYEDNMLGKYLYLVYINSILDEIKLVMSYKYDLL